MVLVGNGNDKNDGFLVVTVLRLRLVQTLQS